MSSSSKCAQPASDSFREWVAETVTSQQVSTLFHETVGKKRKAGDCHTAMPNPAKRCILDMTGDVVASAILNVQQLRERTKIRRIEIREKQWAAFEVELDKLLWEKADLGEDRIKLKLGRMVLEEEFSWTFLPADLSTAKEWMVTPCSALRKKLSEKGFTFVRVWADEVETGFDEPNYYLSLSWD
eukprot:TRINITY_DN45685_c0_g1_i1.p1 TRINITY_DN45685_c0_g1~~TRINITY_DN45685_c0_g1_i1.p1  ORF type:complete len:185 (+),score=28.69 TRINITY_DN45685_c0_g1_i1:38-592(+)